MRTKKKGNEGGSSTKKALIFKSLSDIINKSGRFRVTSPAKGIFSPLCMISKDDPEIVELVPPSDVAASLVKYCSKRFPNDPDYTLTARDADAAVAFWLYDTEPVPTPKAFAWPGEGGLAFTRLPWTAEAGETPTWERILSRMSNRKAFMAWIGSLFDEKGYEQQYVWMHGKGLEGKGSINRFLERVFGPAYCTKQPPGRWGDKFWTHGLLGKRLCVFTDCDDTAFVASGLFKCLTGGDPIAVEGKGKAAYTTKLNAKYLLFSNERPSLSSDVADKRRIIYCEIEPRSPGKDPNDVDFESKLWEEGGAFLGNCLAAYSSTVGQPIHTEEEGITDWIETVEMPFSQVFDLYFVETDARDRWLTGIQLQSVLKQQFKYRKEQLDFISWLERTKGIKKKIVDNDDKSRAYKGLGLKPPLLVGDQCLLSGG